MEDAYKNVIRFCNTDSIGSMVAATYTVNNITDWAKVAEKLNMNEEIEPMIEEQEFDALDDATNAELPPSEYYGEIQIDAWSCVLTKGVGKEIFDGQIHNESQKRTAVDIILRPLSESNLDFSIDRNLIAQSAAWTKITWPSAQEHGITNARELKGKFVKAGLVPTGRTWDKKDENGIPTGEKGTETTLKFLKIYADQTECVAEYIEKFGDRRENAQESAVAKAPASPRDTALTFAKAVITNAYREDPDNVNVLVAAKFAEMPMINEHLTVNDPDVVALIAKCIADAKKD